MHQSLYIMNQRFYVQLKHLLLTVWLVFLLLQKTLSVSFSARIRNGNSNKDRFRQTRVSVKIDLSSGKLVCYTYNLMCRLQQQTKNIISSLSESKNACKMSLVKIELLHKTWLHLTSFINVIGFVLEMCYLVCKQIVVDHLIHYTNVMELI